MPRRTCGRRHGPKPSRRRLALRQLRRAGVQHDQRRPRSRHAGVGNEDHRGPDMEARRVRRVVADAGRTGSAAVTRVAAVALVSSAAAGCNGIQDMMAPAGPAAHRIASLGWFVLIAFSIVTVVLWVLVFWLSLRRRGSLATHQPYDAV